MKAEAEKKQDVMTLSDSDDVQTISSGSDDNKEKEKVTLGKKGARRAHSALVASPSCSPPPAARSLQV